MIEQSVVDIVFHSAQSHILLVQHINPKAYGKWGLPGGHVEKNESNDQAIVREVNEELGVILNVDALSKPVMHTHKLSDGTLYIHTYFVKWQHAPIKLQDSELIGYGWFDIHTINTLANNLRSAWLPSLLADNPIPLQH